MPPWAQVVISVTAVIGAVAYLWKTVLKPGARLISTMDKLLPVAIELTEQFHDAPEAFVTLREIAQQFKADSGTSLRDVINRLERSADDNRAAVKTLEANIETARQLAEQDRAHLAAVIAKLDKANAGIEAAAETVAENDRPNGR
jgi:methyl-accepting chemotaxis protein